MKQHWRPRLTRDIVVRIIADAAMINAALLIALILRYLWLVGVESAAVQAPAVFRDYIKVYLHTCWILTATSLIVFGVSGFYTRGRFYPRRTKMLVIIQAVSLSYLILGFFMLLLHDVIPFPRSVLLVGWFLTLVFLVGARLWTMLWSALAQVEYWLLPPHSPNGKVQNVLVIGGAGYIGSVLVRRLLDLGYHVRVLDLLLYGDAPISGFYGHPGFELIPGDLRHIDAMVRAAQGMDAIVHLGAIVGDSACSINEDLTIEINLRATRTIAEVGKGFGVKRFVFASTCSVYGASDEMLDERSALRPISLYARTKIESEKVLLGLADATFAPTILRFGTVYGLAGRLRFDLVVNLLAAKAVQDGEAGIFGGDQWRPLVHVKDVAEAIVLTLQAPLDSVRGEIFNVGCNDENYQIAELGPIIQEIVPAARIVVQPVEDQRNYRVRFDKIHNTLNFQPRYTVRDGVREVVDAFAKGQVTDYRDPRYSNVKALNEQDLITSILAADVGNWDWIRLTSGDAQMLTEIIMAVIESQSPQLMSHLRDSLVQAILGDSDGFLNTLTGMQLPPSRRGLPHQRSIARVLQ